MNEVKRQELRLNARAVLRVADAEGWSEADQTRHLANLALEAVDALKQAIHPDIIAEREYQDQKWGVQNHPPSYWLAILMEEVGEAAKCLVEGNPWLALRHELIQVAAVAVAAIESLDRNEMQR